ncbi:MAG: sugar porter family MFS transporter [Chitinophagaceae bacterium]|nr:sugar porter family MFS transporter [Chitinophagaceae bacterium]
MLKTKLFRWSVVASLAGFIFGFDTVVISGANIPIKNLWNTTPLFHGFFIMSMALWGTLFGSIFGGIPTDRYGRKKVLIVLGILFAISAIGSALANGPYVFSLFRFIGGIGIGVSSVVAPTYISEISTPKTRGKLGALYQFNIVFGILAAFLSNYFLQGFGGENDWRWMLGILLVPSVIFTLMVFGIPESPRWLITQKNNILAASNIFKEMGVEDVQKEVDFIIKGNKTNSSDFKTNSFFIVKHKKVIWLAFLIAFFNQLSGINFILYYAPEILSRIGLGAKDSLLNSIAIGGINLIFTFVGLYLIDIVGRKKLLLIGSIGYIISLSLVAGCFISHASPFVLMSFLLLFIAAHAIGQGAVIWVFISEIFPNRLRATGQAFGASVHWVFAAIITLITPLFLDENEGIFKDNPWPIFVFFALMMVVQLIWVLFKMPETKGVSLEEIENKLIK